jgi:hypothetical protein
MSTHIYNGYRLDLGGESLLTFVGRLRGELDPVYVDLYTTTVVGIATQMADALLLGDELYAKEKGPLLSHRPLFCASRVLDEAKRDIDSTGKRNPALDFSCSVTFLEDDGNIYALLFTEKNEYRSVFEAMVEVTAYGYWNNTDRDPDVSEDEWDERRLTWERLYADGVTCQVGVTWSLLGEVHHASSTFLSGGVGIENYLWTKEKRAVAIAGRQARRAMDEARGPLDSRDTSAVIRALREERPEREALAASMVSAIAVELPALEERDLADLTRLLEGSSS